MVIMSTAVGRRLLDGSVPLSYEVLGILGMACMGVSELLVQFYTWESTFRLKRLLKAGGMNQPFLSLLVRDGASCSFVSSWLLHLLAIRVDLGAFAYLYVLSRL